MGVQDWVCTFYSNPPASSGSLIPLYFVLLQTLEGALLYLSNEDFIVSFYFVCGCVLELGILRSVLFVCLFYCANSLALLL